MKIEPARRINGILSLPGDKAISHRAAILCALARGRTRVENFSTGEDCAATVKCLRQLGVGAEFRESGLEVEGVGLRGLRASANALDCGNSGSTMRMLAGVLAGQSFDSILTGDASLRARPMRRIIEPLRMMGASVEAQSGCAPLRIRGGKELRAIEYRMPVASAQVKTSILLAGLYSRGRTRVIETLGATRDHTERMLEWFGVPVEIKIGAEQVGHTISIEGQSQIQARDFSVPGDISSAAFFIAAALMLSGSKLEIKSVGLNRTRAQVIEVLRSLGAHIETIDVRQQCNETVGELRVSGGPGLSPVETGRSNILRGALIPQLIDELPVLAVIGTQVEGGITIRDARELRVKETDRIAATVMNLRAMGASVEEHEDGLTVMGRTELRGARLDSLGDHRIAMAFTVAALVARGESEIVGADCASISFPEFYRLLEEVVER